MSWMDLKFLGLNYDQIQALRKACREQHPKGGMSTASGCCCGASSGGPAGSDACRALMTLEESGRRIRLLQPPLRDPSICHHEHDGKATVWEYQGKTHCEMCGKEV